MVPPIPANKKSFFSIHLFKKKLFSFIDKYLHLIPKQTNSQKLTDRPISNPYGDLVTQEFLKPQLKIFASLDPNLNKSLKNEGWFEECQDSNLIARLWKKFNPAEKGKIFLYRES